MKAVLKLVKSFGYAFRGIGKCIKNCRNFRIHTVAVSAVLYFSRYFDLNSTQYALLFLTFGLVLGTEAVNTALEYTCNAVTKDVNNNIKYAKDCAAGGVLISAIFAVCVAFSMFYKPSVFRVIAEDIAGSFVKILLLSAFILISVIYVFYEDIFKNGNK